MRKIDNSEKTITRIIAHSLKMSESELLAKRGKTYDNLFAIIERDMPTSDVLASIESVSEQLGTDAITSMVVVELLLASFGIFQQQPNAQPKPRQKARSVFVVPPVTGEQ